MPKRTNEDSKKHGDTLEPLIERTGGDSSAGKRSAKRDPADLQDDEEENLQSDDDEPRDGGED